MKTSKVNGPLRRVFTTPPDPASPDIESLVELIVLPDIFGQKPAGYIHKVYTDEASRGKNYATGLVKEAVKTAFEQYGCYKVFLISDRETVPFYERLGMREHQVGMEVRP